MGIALVVIRIKKALKMNMKKIITGLALVFPLTKQKYDSKN